mmetsp:Transcript_10412/g.30218  ORF Transcript_10412/g.30218 Transcript_10412/m.30218 type:complete len:295 (-) Transcript_10412:238-1122(-)
MKTAVAGSSSQRGLPLGEVAHPNATLCALRRNGDQLLLRGAEAHVLQPTPVDLHRILRYREAVERIDPQRIVRDGDEGLLLNPEFDSLYGRRTELCRGHCLERLQTPQLHGPVGGTRCKEVLLGMERNRPYRPLVDLEVSHQLSGGEVPHLDHAILSAGRDPTPMWAEADAVDGVRMAFVGLDTRLPPQIPNLQVRICRARSEELTVGVELHSGARSSVACECACHLPVLQVPDLHRAPAATYYQDLLLLVKDEALYRGRVALQAHHGVRLPDLPYVNLLVLAARRKHLAGLLP